MTHTKPTREAIARLIFEQYYQLLKPETRDALWQEDREKEGFQVYFKSADAILAHLTALEPAPAGGDVQELVEALKKADAFLKDRHRATYDDGPVWIDGAAMNLSAKIRQALTATPQSGWRPGRKSTEMHDEEGREIFEGDWVQFNVSFFDGNFKDEPISGKVVYVPELMSFQLVNVQSDYWREYTGGDDSTYQPFSEMNFSEADFRVIDPPLPQPPKQRGE